MSPVNMTDSEGIQTKLSPGVWAGPGWVISSTVSPTVSVKSLAKVTSGSEGSVPSKASPISCDSIVICIDARACWSAAAASEAMTVAPCACQYALPSQRWS